MALGVSIKEINLDYKIERGPSILKKLRTKARLIFQVLKVIFTKPFPANGKKVGGFRQGGARSC